MKTKIEVWVDDIQVICPNCGEWESQPIDQQRHHLQTFSILEWKPDVEGKNEVSVMECTGCTWSFELEWDYQNEQS